MKFLCAAFLASATVLAAGESVSWTPPDATVTATWNSNASNADRGADVIGALQLAADVDAFSTRFPLGHDDALLFSGNLAVEAWPRFDLLGRASLGPRLAWQHKFGLGALAPVLRLEISADAIDARDDERSGLSGTGRLAWSQRFDESTRFTASVERTRRQARDELYDQTATAAAAGISYEFDESWSMTLEARWRQGDVLSYSSLPRPDLAALARDHDTVNTFHAPMVAYAIDGRSLGGALTLTRTLGERTFLTFGYEGRTIDRASLRYVNHLVSTSLNHQF